MEIAGILDTLIQGKPSYIILVGLNHTAQCLHAINVVSACVECALILQTFAAWSSLFGGVSLR